MDQGPSWELSRFAASQEIPRILWNPKVHRLVYKSPPPVLILYQISQVQATLFNFMGADLLVFLFHIGKGLNCLSFLCLEYPGKYYPGCGLITFLFLV